MGGINVNLPNKIAKSQLFPIYGIRKNLCQNVTVPLTHWEGFELMEVYMPTSLNAANLSEEVTDSWGCFTETLQNIQFNSFENIGVGGT